VVGNRTRLAERANETYVVNNVLVIDDVLMENEVYLTAVMTFVEKRQR